MSENELLYRLNAAFIPIKSLALVSSSELAEFKGIITQRFRLATFWTVVLESGVISALARSLNTNSRGDATAQQRFEAIIELFETIAGCGLDCFYDTQGCFLLAQSGAIEQVSRLLAHPGRDTTTRSLSLRLLRLVRVIAMSPFVLASTRHAVLLDLLAYVRRTHSHNYINSDDTEATDARYIDMLCGAVATLCSHGVPAPRTTAAGFVPLLRGVLQRRSAGVESDRNAREAAYDALHGVFRSSATGCGGGVGCGGGHVADLALSAEFDDLIQDLPNHATWWRRGKYPPLLLLHQCVTALNDAVLDRAFTPQRLQAVVAALNADRRTKTLAMLVPLTGLLLRLAQRFPAFAQQLVGGPLLERVFDGIVKPNGPKGEAALSSAEEVTLQRNTVRLLDCLLSTSTATASSATARTATATTASATGPDTGCGADAGVRTCADFDARTDGVYVAQQLLAAGAMKCCVALLGNITLWSGGVNSDANSDSSEPVTHTGPSADTVARLVRVVRVMIATNKPSAAAAVAPEGGAAAQPDVVAQFVTNHGPQALELLRYNDCMSSDGDSGPALQELSQLQALLARLGLIAPVAAETAEEAERRRTTIDEVRAFSQSYQGGWREAFDAYIASKLEESGYPQQVVYHAEVDKWKPLYATTPRIANALSNAALALLQAKARGCIFAVAQSRLETNEMTADSVMKTKLYNTLEDKRDEYQIVIRLNDEKFPSHAAHFRTAANAYAFGSFIHRCFVPPGQSAGSLPFVTMFHYSHNVSCTTAPLKLPSSDLVFGEYAAPASGVTYPVGTVLMYPRAAVSRELTNNAGTYDTPWFIVFKPCPASLLRGAVPVGRVTSCMPGKEPATHDSGSKPFDSTVLQWLEKHCKAGKCSKSDGTSTHSFIIFSIFRSR